MRAWILGFLLLGSTAAHADLPGVDDVPPVAHGDLDKAVIRATVRTQIQKIQYCYEKELIAKPGIAGTVMVQFFITPNGTVASASGTGVDPNVATCVAGVIKTLTFAKPKGGGGVQVNYPFTFHPYTPDADKAAGDIEAKGDLDKDIIRRVVVREIPKIQYCYEKTLLSKPNLAGTVKVKFFIAPTGKVASSSGTGMDPDVASCVAGVIKDLEFPKPKGGGGVEVNYPFVFKPAESHKGIDLDGEIIATQNLASADIGAAIAPHKPKLRACYDKFVAQNPKAPAGEVTIVWGIGRDGKVDAAMPSNPEPGMCLAEAIRAIQFPKPAKGGIVHVSWRIAYRP